MSHRRTSILSVASYAALLGAAAAVMNGCEVDSFFDPGKTLYGQRFATSTPILDRIDAIERGSERQWANATDVTPEDLLPSDLEYRLAPGDIVVIEVFELILPREFTRVARRVDQSGNVRLPLLGDIPAAGLTPQELEDNIIEVVEQTVRDPIVTVSLEQPQGLYFTVAGNIAGQGTYPISRPDLRLDQALGFAGGAPFTTEAIYVTRAVALSGDYEAFPDRRGPTQPTTPNGPTQPVDIDDLIRDVGGDGGGGGGGGDGGGGVNPGTLGDARNAQPGNNTEEPIQIIDVDDLQIKRISSDPNLSPADFSRRNDSPGRASRAGSGASFVFIEERGWVRAGAVQDPGDDVVDQMLDTGDEEIVLERVIRVPYKRLLSDGRYNIVIRPGDRIYVSPPLTGVVYIGGEVLRPGVYQLPIQGKLTLSQLITAAGGFGPLASPSRIDFTRRVAESRDATIRLNGGAIRQKTEPDIFIKPDDHIIVGTSWVAAPLAVIRNGFRATYGFGFLLDRNFGPDVFGAPPRSAAQ